MRAETELSPTFLSTTLNARVLGKGFQLRGIKVHWPNNGEVYLVLYGGEE